MLSTPFGPSGTQEGHSTGKTGSGVDNRPPTKSKPSQSLDSGPLPVSSPAAAASADVQGLNALKGILHQEEASKLQGLAAVQATMAKLAVAKKEKAEKREKRKRARETVLNKADDEVQSYRASIQADLTQVSQWRDEVQTTVTWLKKQGVTLKGLAKPLGVLSQLVTDIQENLETTEDFSSGSAKEACLLAQNACKRAQVGYDKVMALVLDFNQKQKEKLQAMNESSSDDSELSSDDSSNGQQSKLPEDHHDPRSSKDSSDEDEEDMELSGQDDSQESQEDVSPLEHDTSGEDTPPPSKRPKSHPKPGDLDDVLKRFAREVQRKDRSPNRSELAKLRDELAVATRFAETKARKPSSKKRRRSPSESDVYDSESRSPSRKSRPYQRESAADKESRRRLRVLEKMLDLARGRTIYNPDSLPEDLREIIQRPSFRGDEDLECDVRGLLPPDGFCLFEQDEFENQRQKDIEVFRRYKTALPSSLAGAEFVFKRKFTGQPLSECSAEMDFPHVTHRAAVLEGKAQQLRSFMESEDRDESVRWKPPPKPKPSIKDVVRELPMQPEPEPLEAPPVGLPATKASRERISRIAYAPEELYSSRSGMAASVRLQETDYKELASWSTTLLDSEVQAMGSSLKATKISDHIKKVHRATQLAESGNRTTDTKRRVPLDPWEASNQACVPHRAALKSSLVTSSAIQVGAQAVSETKHQVALLQDAQAQMSEAAQTCQRIAERSLARWEAETEEALKVPGLRSKEKKKHRSDLKRAQEQYGRVKEAVDSLLTVEDHLEEISEKLEVADVASSMAAETSLATTDASCRGLRGHFHECRRHVATALCTDNSMTEEQKVSFLAKAIACPYTPSSLFGGRFAMGHTQEAQKVLQETIQHAGGRFNPQLFPGLGISMAGAVVKQAKQKAQLSAKAAKRLKRFRQQQQAARSKPQVDQDPASEFQQPFQTKAPRGGGHRGGRTRASRGANRGSRAAFRGNQNQNRGGQGNRGHNQQTRAKNKRGGGRGQTKNK